MCCFQRATPQPEVQHLVRAAWPYLTLCILLRLLNALVCSRLLVEGLPIQPVENICVRRVC